MPPLSRKFNLHDPQRERVYAAERAADIPRASEFESLAEIRPFVATVLASPTWLALAASTRQAGRGVELRLGRGQRALAIVPIHNLPGIYLPRDRWRRWTVFHELAHCARGRLMLNHGPQFTASYLRLLRECWDPALAERRVRVAPWGHADGPIPVPDPATLDDRRDEGADEDRARERSLLEAAVANLQTIAAQAQERLRSSTAVA